MDVDAEGPVLAVGSASLYNLLPATYRPIVLFCIGLWGWALNLYILQRCHIDTASLLGISHSEKSRNIYSPLFNIASVLSTIVAINLWLFWKFVLGAATLTNVTRSWLPLMCYLLCLLVVFWPGHIFYSKERYRFTRSMLRLFSFNVLATVYFSDVVLADIMTSFANVFGDLWATGCALIVNKGIVDYLVVEHQSGCYRDIMGPLMTSIPYIIRFKQCIFEYLESDRKTQKHLLNACKYASAFPVIMLSATQKIAAKKIDEQGELPDTWWIGDTGLFRLWMFFVFINSTYSFIWDVSMDWNLVSLTFTTGDPVSQANGISNHTRNRSSIPSSTSFIREIKSVISSLFSPTIQPPPLLRFRRHLHFSHRILYVGAMLIDFVLRTTWSLKLSSHLSIKQLEGSIIIMELLEIFRRWIWVFFRLESEWVKRSQHVLPRINEEMEEFDLMVPKDGN
ncbi:EXS family-domain-containing protein [Umbelopsis sp. PMI_123]|nr:EXS family-domain-containing protein [Umbelopsis sp. PMI_123]